MRHRAPRTLAGDLRVLRQSLRIMLAHLRADLGLYAWALVIGLSLAVLLGAWFGVID